MALFTVDHFSEALGLSMTCLVILPQPTPGRIGMPGNGRPDGDRHPTLWLLHGRSDDHTTWLRRTSVERYLAAAGMAAVMPSVHLSRYANTASGEAYWDYISAELPALLESWLPIGNTRETRFVAGLSMGGWGTMKLALNRPERFSAAASLSGSLRLDPAAWRRRAAGDPAMHRYLTRIFGAGTDVPNPDDRLLERVREHVAAGTPLPRLYACCGTEDFLLEDNREAVRLLRGLGVDITYEEGPGRHEWAFWDMAIRRAVRWMGFPSPPAEPGLTPC